MVKKLSKYDFQPICSCFTLLKCKNYIFCVFFSQTLDRAVQQHSNIFKSRSRGQGQGHVIKVKVTWSNSRSCDQGLVTVTRYHMLNSLKRQEMPPPSHHKVTWQKLRSRDFLWSRDLVMVTWPYLRARSRDLDLGQALLQELKTNTQRSELVQKPTYTLFPLNKHYKSSFYVTLSGCEVFWAHFMCFLA